jgi:hypothetical protein
MNTTVIIVLGVLILIVVVAIVVILIKGKDPSEVNTANAASKGNSFQEETLKPANDAVQEPEMTQPKLHQKEVEQPTTPVSPPPVMNNLATPQQTPSLENSAVPMGDEPTTIKDALNQPVVDEAQSELTQDQDMFKSNPLPDDSQMNSDMEMLQKSQQSPNTTQPEDAFLPDSAQQTEEQFPIEPPAEPMPTQEEPTVTPSQPVTPPVGDGSINTNDNPENTMPQQQTTPNNPTPTYQPGQVLPSNPQDFTPPGNSDI